jgi:hypothetical protein
MQGRSTGQTNPELRELIAEASNALARLDTARLEELALSCEALNRGLDAMAAKEKTYLARQARESAAGMAVFARVIEATRANLRVMNRLRELRAGRLEYSEPQVRGRAAPKTPANGAREAVSCLPSGATGLCRWSEGAEGTHGDH